VPTSVLTRTNSRQKCPGTNGGKGGSFYLNVNAHGPREAARCFPTYTKHSHGRCAPGPPATRRRALDIRPRSGGLQGKMIVSGRSASGYSPLGARRGAAIAGGSGGVFMTSTLEGGESLSRPARQQGRGAWVSARSPLALALQAAARSPLQQRGGNGRPTQASIPANASSRQGAGSSWRGVLT
jgi:hypothetical protein